MPKYVIIRDLTFAYSDRKLFDRVNIDIPRGKITTIMGPSGTGKTTLLRLIGGQLRPKCGSIVVDGQEVSRLSCDRLYEMRKRMGMLFQSGALFTDLNVFENVAYPLREHTALSEKLIRHVVMMKLEAVGLRGAHALMPSELSGGMSRRVALARAIALDPEMVMYDEPFVGQDPITAGVLMELIHKLNKHLGLTSIIVSHDVQEACKISDYLYITAGGKIVDHGIPEAVFQSRSELTRQFLKGLPDGPLPYEYPSKDLREDFLGVKAN